MTRAERLAEQAARAQAQLDAQRERLAKVKAQHQQAVQKERAQRRELVAQMVEDAGLCALSDTDLAVLFQLLIPLLATPNPVAVLAGLLEESGAGSGTGLTSTALQS